MALPLDLHAAEFLEDPAPTLRRIREHDPVHESPHGYWVLTRYEDVAAALRDPRLSSEWARKATLPTIGRRPTRTGDPTDPFERAPRIVLHSCRTRRTAIT